jgi:hypothetical protein
MELRFSEHDVVLYLSDKIDDASLESLMKIGLRDRFPKEFVTWERSRREVIQRFQGIRTERQNEMHIKLERNLENLNVKIREAVITEVLKAFP